jgi:hypothetical protein
MHIFTNQKYSSISIGFSHKSASLCSKQTHDPVLCLSDSIDYNLAVLPISKDRLRSKKFGRVRRAGFGHKTPPRKLVEVVSRPRILIHRKQSSLFASVTD